MIRLRRRTLRRAETVEKGELKRINRPCDRFVAGFPIGRAKSCKIRYLIRVVAERNAR